MESESKVAEPDNVERPRRVIVSRSGDEGIRLEKLRMLRTSRSAYRGAINRIKGRTEGLMRDPTNREAIELEKASLHRTFIEYSKYSEDFIENLLPEEEFDRLEVANEYDSVSKLIDEFSERIKGWIASNETELTFHQNPEASVQSELTTSRLKEHERLTTSFAYPNMHGYGDLNNVDEDKYIQPKSPSRQSSAQEAVSESLCVGKVQIKEAHTCKDDHSATVQQRASRL